MAFFFLTHASICGTTDKTMVSNGMPQSAVVVSVKHGKPTWFPSETLKARAMRRSVAKVEVRSAASEAKPAEWCGAYCLPGVNAKSTRRRGGIRWEYCLNRDFCDLGIYCDFGR